MRQIKYSKQTVLMFTYFGELHPCMLHFKLAHIYRWGKSIINIIINAKSFIKRTPCLALTHAWCQILIKKLRMKYLQASNRSSSNTRLTRAVSCCKSTHLTHQLILLARYNNSNEIVNINSIVKWNLNN